ncbi:hypothetical protein NDU88_003131 [Pleurodeles waltl]|uniref:Uncharacterized protein n=1 Tax=Pleurodeles waltl TaxID=8319 RepID=A0AAV7L589_PLEWA|nr:hypothetical protein NDU88_003131 [Pleurodeles waltl]
MGLRRRGIKKGDCGPMGDARKTGPDDSNRINPPQQRAKKRERRCLNISAARTASPIWSQTSETPRALSVAPRG